MSGSSGSKEISSNFKYPFTAGVSRHSAITRERNKRMPLSTDDHQQVNGVERCFPGTTSCTVRFGVALPQCASVIFESLPGYRDMSYRDVAAAVWIYTVSKSTPLGSFLDIFDGLYGN